MTINLLFICTLNQWRSRTAEEIFKNQPGISVRSAGTALNARIVVGRKDLQWADHIFVMENKHKEFLMKKFPEETHNKKIICLDIPDQYEFMDEELIQILRESMSVYL